MATTPLVTTLLAIGLPPALLLLLAKRSTRRRKSCLPGKVVWITGASSGLGEQLAISAAAGGAEGLILSGRREDALERVKTACEEEIAKLDKGGGGAAARVRVLPFDVADFDFVEKEAAARALDMFGRIDALVLNAGISTRGSIEETSLDVDRRVMAVNYFGPVGLAKGLLLEASRRPPPQPSLPSTSATPGTTAEEDPAKTSTSTSTNTAAGGGGAVTTSGVGTPADPSRPRGVLFVVINSVQGKFGMGFRSSYAASKHALVGFFDCLRAEHASRGLGVLSVFPGYVRTSLSVNALEADGTKHAQMDATTAQGRDPREVADEIWRAAAEGKDEIVIADLKTRVALLLRAFAPRVLFKIMAKRAVKARPTEEQ
ncbi:unnamed protein product [Scytosiphon promiscuus]